MAKAFADPTRQRIVSLLEEQPATTKQLAEAPGPEAGGDCPPPQGARGGRVRAGGAHPTDQGHYEEVPREHPPPNNLLGAQLLPASVAGYFTEKVLELVKGFEVDPVPGERVYAFLGAVFLTNQPELPEEES